MTAKITTVPSSVEPEVRKPSSLDAMSTEEFNSIMERGLLQAKSNQSRTVINVFTDLRQHCENR